VTASAKHSTVYDWWLSCGTEEVLSWEGANETTRCGFSSMSKRRKGYPSEARVKRGDRLIHGKEFIRKARA
jgi:hypothetical protein